MTAPGLRLAAVDLRAESGLTVVGTFDRGRLLGDVSGMRHTSVGGPVASVTGPRHVPGSPR